VIRVSRLADDHVGIVTIDRPAARNAFTRAMWSAAAAALDELAADDDVRVVLLTGAGDVFSAGADVTEMRAVADGAEGDGLAGSTVPAPETGVSTTTSGAGTQGDDADAGGPFHAFLDTLDGFPKPLVAAVNGAAVGAGFTMLCYCDLVLASTTARFKVPFVPMGLTPEAGSSRLLPERIGWQEAAHLFFTGAWLDAAEAHRLGFVWRTFPPAGLLPAATALCRSIGTMPLDALRETKRLLVTAGRNAGPVRRRESEVFRRLLAAQAARQEEPAR
jgi:enoyl-CoA hydratase/carnithine racemase